MGGFFNNKGSSNNGGVGGVVQDFKYTNSTPTSSDFGGIKAGTTFNQVGIKEMFDMMLYPFKNPAIRLSSDISTSTVKELGVDVITGVVLTATTTKGTADIDRIEFIDNKGVILDTQSLNGNNVNQYTFNGIIDNTYTFTVKVYDVKGNVASSTVKFNFEHPFYYGSTKIDVLNLTEADIIALNKVVELRETKSLSFTHSNEKAIFVYPDTWGNSNSKGSK